MICASTGCNQQQSCDGTVRLNKRRQISRYVVALGRGWFIAQLGLSGTKPFADPAYACVCYAAHSYLKVVA
jgi:hypothetical protein